MRIMTYNILNGGIDDKGSRIDHIINTINEGNPDFLALQEANDFDKNDNELLKRVSNETKLSHHALSRGTRYENGKRYHVVILSRFSLKEVYTFPDSSFQTAALSVVIDSPLGELSICTVHLHVGTEDERLKEIEAVMKYQSSYEKHIILGDFNSISQIDNYDDLSADEFTYYGLNRFDVTDLVNKNYVDALSYLNVKDRSTHPTIGVSHPTSKTLIRIDYIFITRSLSSNIKSGSVLKTESSEVASDHYPVVVTLN